MSKFSRRLANTFFQINHRVIDDFTKQEKRHNEIEKFETILSLNWTKFE